MANAIITYAWAIEDKKSWTSLTGSKTVVDLQIWKLQTPKILVDCWAVQWVKNANKFNKEIDSDIINADYLIITHAHADHAWLVPYLVKKWFSWTILMTELTKMQSVKMWEDSIRVTKKEIKWLKDWNERIREKLEKSFKIKSLYESIKSWENVKELERKRKKIISENNKISKPLVNALTIKSAYERLADLKKQLNDEKTEGEKEKIQRDIIRVESRLKKSVKWKDFDLAYNEAIDLLNSKNIKTQEDILPLLQDVPEITFDPEAKEKLAVLLWEKDVKVSYEESIATIKEYWVESLDDISSVFRDMPELLFDEDDIEPALEKVKIINTNDELEIANFHPVTRVNDEVIENLPLEARAWRKKPVVIDASIRLGILKKFGVLKRKIIAQIQENQQIDIENQQLKENLTLALKLVHFCRNNWLELEKFEREYWMLLWQDEAELSSQANALEQINLYWDNFWIDRLLRFYNTFSDKLWITQSDFENLKWELSKYAWIELSDLEAKSYDEEKIKNYFKKILVIDEKNKDTIKIWENDIFIDSLEKYSIEDIIWYFESWKKIFIKKEIRNALRKSILDFVKYQNNKTLEYFENIKSQILTYISSHLPELPDTNYENKDVREVFKKAFLVWDSENIKIDNFSVFIDNLDKYSPKEIFGFFRAGKKLYVKENIKDELFKKLVDFVKENQKTLDENNNFKKQLNHAFDLIEIFDWNDDLYLDKNRKLYETAFQFTSNYKPKNIKNSLYSKEQLDETLDIDFESISKNKKIIKIKKLDDTRLYDILFNEDKNIVYYFEPRIRERIKQKLSAKIDEIQKENQNEILSVKRYEEYKNFIRIYEARIILDSYKDYEFDFEKAIKFLQENAIDTRQDIENMSYEKIHLYSNSDISKFLKWISYVSSEAEIKDENGIFIESLEDERLFDFLNHKWKIFIKNTFTKNDIETALKNYREKQNLLEKSQKDEVEKLKTRLFDALNFVSALNLLKKQWFDENELTQARTLLSKYWIENRNQISLLNTFDADIFIKESDIAKIVWSFFSVWNDFSQEQIDIVFIDDINDDRIYDLPYIYNDASKIVVIRNDLQEEVSKKLKKWMWDFYRTRKVRKERKQEILEKLKLYEFYVKNYKFLFGLEWWKTPEDFYNELIKRKQEISSLREQAKKISFAKDLKSKLTLSEWNQNELQKARELLNRYNIKRLEDIDWVLKRFHEIPYSIDDIEKAKLLLKSVHIDKNQEILESVKLNFFDAWHVEWSVQSVITYVVSEVDNTISTWNSRRKWVYGNTSQRKLKHVNLWFSWDMWRIKQPNLSWTPENILFKLDFRSNETTYAWRNHPDKQKSIEELLASIFDAEWKVVIPAFSLQRTQELLITLLKARVDSIDHIGKLNYHTNQKSKNQKRISELNKIRNQVEEKDVLEREIVLLEARLRNIKNDENIKPENYWEEIKRLQREIRVKNNKLKQLPNNTLEEIDDEIEKLEREISISDLQIKVLKPKVFDTDIILDSPLSEEITNIYINHCWVKYDILNPETQKKLFWREIIKYVKKKKDPLSESWLEEDRERISLEEIYSDERRDKKEIIISASWMCDWWAIDYHLKQNLPNKKSKIIFIWYCPENTRWWKIKAKNEFISFDGKPIPLNCEVDDIAWFSAHMDEYEIIDFLTNQKFNRDAIIALTHGWDGRFELARKLEVVMHFMKQKVKIIVPKHWEEVKVKI